MQCPQWPLLPARRLPDSRQSGYAPGMHDRDRRSWARYSNAEGRALASRYETLDPDKLNAWFADLLPEAPASVLDVGAGTGRDAAWLAARGYDVVAAEPSRTMFDAARARHRSPSIVWFRDHLPSLETVFRHGASFDVILLNAVWMHTRPRERPRAFRKLVSLLKPGGLLAFTLRQGEVDEELGTFPADADEIENLARSHGAFVVRRGRAADGLGRPHVHWERIALRLADDGTGALPLLRHIILNDAKSATYKLGLLRSVARAADGAFGMARRGEDSVAVPFGLLALNWLRLYKPLVASGLPQRPGNRGADGLGFIGNGWHGIADVPASDLRVGAAFTGATARALHGAIRDACDNMLKMPIRFMTYPGSPTPVLAARRGRAGSPPDGFLIDRAYLSRFGEVSVPAHLWNALARHDAWIEPALVAEWTALMDGYAERQGRSLDRSEVARAMTWSSPSRDVQFVRQISDALMERDELFCVWTGRRLTRARRNIDHCMPWAAWPCDDLWNLLPADRTVNQRQKRARLPSADALRIARDRICSWWEKGYLAADRVSEERFFAEARSSLPLEPLEEPDLDDLFCGLELRRRALRTDQKVEEWTPASVE